MSSIPRLHYFVEKETAESATKNFAIILQKAFEQYQNLWDKYLDLVKVYEIDNPAHQAVHKACEKENILKSAQVLPQNIDFLNKYANGKKPCEKEEEKCIEKEKENMVEDIFEACRFDFDLDIDETICQTPRKEIENIILPESPIFQRKDKKLIPAISKKETFIRNDDNTNLLLPDNTLDFSKQCNDASSPIPTKYINDMSYDGTSPVIICNSPMPSNESYKKNRKRLLKKTCEYKQLLKESSVSPEKQQVEKKKVPLQSLENLSPSKVNLDNNETETYYKYINVRSRSFVQNKYNIVSPDDKKLRQTTLPYYVNRNKVDNNVVKSTDSNVRITKPKKSVFNCYPERTSSENKDIGNTKIDTVYAENFNNQNKTIYDDIVENSPESVHVQPQKKNPLQSKRKISETDKEDSIELLESIIESDSVFTSPFSSPMKIQSQAFSTKKRNIASNNAAIILSSGIGADDSMETSFEISKDAQLEQKSEQKINFEENAAVELQESTLLDDSQFGNEDETYFEEQIEVENNLNLNKMSPIQKTLKDTHYKLETPKINAVTKGATIKTKEGWSCWECAEYYKNKPGLTKECVQKWKNQCSRHRNVYYARQGTPPGFWDPLFPSSASDSIQEN